jgi:hypothetical protein
MAITPKFCPQCGARFPDGKSCRSFFDQRLALEFEHPTTFGQVLFLPVACYMLQHNAYSKAAWLEARKMVALFVQHGISPDDIRRRMQQKLDKIHRGWSITKGEKLAEFDMIVWSRSIADIRVDSAEIYCADVDGWAKSVVEDTEFIMEKFA